MYLWLLLTFLSWLSGCLSIRGPEAVSGPERGSVTLQCHYDQGWENYKKWWCKGADWSSCIILIKTTGSEQEVKEGRISIRDNQESHTFTVTMGDLRDKDADTYWCGIERTGIDPGFQVKVTINPAPTTVWTTAFITNTFTAQAAPEETTSSPAMTSSSSKGSHSPLGLSTLLPLIFAILLLLLVAASLLAWRMLKQQKKAAGISSEQVPQPLQGDYYYANLTLQQTGASEVSSQKKTSTKSSSAWADQEEVEYVTMVSFPKEEISYAALTLDTSDQDPTYGNMGPLPAHVPASCQEESTEYSAIRKH